MRNISPSDVWILPKNFGELLSFFYETGFEREVKFGRFKVDFFSKNMKLAFEYDGIHHYSNIQKIESDKCKNQLLKNEGIRLVRWPYYFMPTMDTCKYIFQDHYSDQKFASMLDNMFRTSNEMEMNSPGFHSTPNIPANFIWQGINKFLIELETAPRSTLHQVRHSLKIYCQVRKNNNCEIVIPTYHDKFMKFFNENDDNSYLKLTYKNAPNTV